jgi:hypothetical protein
MLWGMRYQLEARHRGVSGYVEVFILIGVAIGGSGIVLDAAMRYSSSAQGPSLLISDGTITQSPYIAVEKLVVSNVGQTALGALVISTQPISQTASYCYSLLDPETMKVLQSTCPEMTRGPGSLTIASGISSGESLLVELVVTGQAFSPGSNCMVTVSSSDGIQESMPVEVVPA